MKLQQFELSAFKLSRYLIVPFRWKCRDIFLIATTYFGEYMHDVLGNVFILKVEARKL